MHVVSVEKSLFNFQFLFCPIVDHSFLNLFLSSRLL
jgi:hypothetical protein